MSRKHWLLLVNALITASSMQHEMTSVEAASIVDDIFALEPANKALHVIAQRMADEGH